MRKILTLSLFLLFSITSFAQNNTRVVKGLVQDTDERPLSGITIKAVSEDVSVVSDQNGVFELKVSPYCRYIEASGEGYFNSKAEIDGSLVIFRLKVDKKYFEAKAKAEEEARIAAEKQAEAERIAAEKKAAARAKAEEEARIAAEKKAEAERIAAEKEAAAKAKAEETARIAAEKQAEAERIAKEKEAVAKAKAEEAARIAAEKQAETERLAKEKETAAKAKAEEAARIAAEKQAEAGRIAKEKEAAPNAKTEEYDRIYAEMQAEVERIAKEKVEKAVANKVKREVTRAEYAKHIKGYESLVNLSYNMMSSESYVGVDYIGGCRFNNHLFFGVGAGVNMQIAAQPIDAFHIKKDESLKLSHGAFYFPVYAHFRAQLLNRRCTPFLALSVGCNISMPQIIKFYKNGTMYSAFSYNASGLFFNPQFGVTYRVKPKLGIYASVGLNASMIPVCVVNSRSEAFIKQGFQGALNVNLGISF